MADLLSWDSDGRVWPNREASRFVTSHGLTWHVQQMGEGPDLLLLHGTGASTHSFAEAARLLAQKFRVTLLDLPGHGFTDMPSPDSLSLPGMADEIGALLKVIGVDPAIAAGHSAGAAILIRMGLDQLIKPKLIVSFNGALRGFRGLAGTFFSPLAKMLVINPFVPRIVTWRASNRDAVIRLLEGTGSKTTDAMIDIYWKLFQTRKHVAAALGMMANWDLPALEKDYAKVKIPVVLVTGEYDKAVPPSDAPKLREAMANAPVEVVTMAGAGHLAHEEAPERAAELILQAARRAGVVP